jgi:rSAM/selenodomain-associated transferase 1
MTEAVVVAVLAKAPRPGFAKTRLIPTLGAAGAALLQARLIEHAIATACAAAIGPVAVWADPDDRHPVFESARSRFAVALARQGDGDLGARMLAAIAAANGPVLVIGSDAPALSPDHLRMAADVLREGTDVVIFPAEDGGYALIGMRAPHLPLFCDMRWSTSGVMAETRRRLQRCGLTWQEPLTLWDLDTPADLARLRAIGMQHLVPAKP